MGTSVYPSFIGPSERNELDQALARIVKAINERTVELLLGAGLSSESDVPLGPNLASQLLRVFFPQDGEDAPTDQQLDQIALVTPLETIAQAVEIAPGQKRADLTKILARILIEPEFPVSEAHRDLLSICYWLGSQPTLDQVFTTNFDLLLDRAFGAKGRAITESNILEIRATQQKGLIPILYLHGRLDRDDYQVTESDIFQERKFRSLHAQFRSALTNADAFIFVGYSLSDPDFRRIYMQFREEIDLRLRAERSTFVVGPAKDAVYYALEKNVWRSRGAIWLPLTAGLFFRRIRELLQGQLDRADRSRIMQKYTLSDDKSYEDLVEQTASTLRVERVDAEKFLLEARPKAGGRE